jgi:UDP-N-acetylglucosamine acyltransferase
VSKTVAVHPTAVVADGAELDAGVEIGPYCVIGPRVRIGSGCRLHSHVVIQGDTHIGEECELFPQVVLGTVPQDRKLKGNESSKLRIGSRNTLREFVTIQGGTPHGGGITRVGDDNMLLIGVHFGHDCRVGSELVITNNALVGGHTEIHDRAVIGAHVGIHQYCRVGNLAMVAAGAMVSKDVPPFGLVQGDRSRVRGINVIGMRRAGYPSDDIDSVRRASRLLFWRQTPLAERIEKTKSALGDHPQVREILDFLANTRRGVSMGRRRGRDEAADEVEID